MFPVEAFSNTVGKFVAIAKSLELPFHLTGGSISSAYGEPRLTQDIDIVISPNAAKQRADDLVMQLVSSDFLFGEWHIGRVGRVAFTLSHQCANTVSATINSFFLLLLSAAQVVAF